MLNVSDDLDAAFRDQAEQAFIARTCAYLRESLPQHTAPIGNAALADMVRTYWQEAGALGLEFEADIERWCLLEILTGGTLFAMESVRMEFDVAATGRVPSETLDMIMDDVVHRLGRLAEKAR